MILFRMAIAKFKDDLSGTGAKIYGGRWNNPGYPALYCTKSISLAVLEILVRTGVQILPPDYYIINLKIPDNISLKTMFKKNLKKDWKTDFEYTQQMGTDFLIRKDFVGLAVPSVIVDEEQNFLLNPLHPDFKKVVKVSTEQFIFDKRLFLTNE